MLTLQYQVGGVGQQATWPGRGPCTLQRSPLLSLEPHLVSCSQTVVAANMDEHGEAVQRWILACGFLAN